MRILFDCRSVHERVGGIGRATAELARHLPQALEPGDHLFLLAGRGYDPECLRPVEPPHFPVTVLGSDAAMIDPVFEQIELPTLVRERQVDLLHTTCFTTSIAARAKRVATVHDVVFRRFPELVEAPLRDYLDHWTGVSCRVADQVVTVSRFSQEEISACYGRPKDEISVVPNGVGAGFFRVERRPPSGPPFLLYVGALEEKKNVRALLRAFRALLARDPSLPHLLLLCGGPGGQQFDLESALEEAGPARERVRVLGRVTDAVLLELLAQASLFAYLSRYEGFGLPPLEAMAAGVPTVVSDLTALPEVVGDSALKVDPDRPGAVAEAFRRLLRDQRLASELSARGRERARTFGWEAAAKELAQVYRRVLLADEPPSKPQLKVPQLKVLVGGSA